jgi:transposase
VKDVDRIERETDVVRLREMAKLLARENQRLVAKVVELTKKLATATGADRAQLQLQLDKLQKQLSGADDDDRRAPKNERRAKSGDGTKADAPQTGHGPKAQPSLDIEIQQWLLDEADRTCPSCGGDLQEWAGQADESEEIDVVERRFVLRKHRRQKYRCGCGHCETAPGPRRWLAGGRYSGAFAISVAVAKYLDHMPLERLCRQMHRQGLDVDSNTLFDQLWALSRLLKPAYDRLPGVQHGRPYLNVDETTWPMLDGSKNWHIWDVVSDVAAYYVIRDGRDTQKARDLLASYDGYIVSDGYVVYASLAKEFPNLKHCACMVHARRKFIECRDQFPRETERILDLIGKLYEIEGRASTREERARLRETESRPVVAELQRVLVASACAPGDALDKAIQYTSRRWSKLTRFLDDPDIPLDNNAAERALRGPVVGRKNHYGSKSLRGTEVAAIFYSLLESAKLVGVNPEDYLRTCLRAHMNGATIPLPHELVAVAS